MRRTRHVVLPVKSWQYMGLMIVSLACLTLGLVSRDREGRSGSLAGPELKHTAPHEVDACPNLHPFTRLVPYDDKDFQKGLSNDFDQDVQASVGSRLSRATRSMNTRGERTERNSDRSYDGYSRSRLLDERKNSGATRRERTIYDKDRRSIVADRRARTIEISKPRKFNHERRSLARSSVQEFRRRSTSMPQEKRNDVRIGSSVDRRDMRRNVERSFERSTRSVALETREHDRTVMNERRMDVQNDRRLMSADRRAPSLRISRSRDDSTERQRLISRSSDRRSMERRSFRSGSEERRSMNGRVERAEERDVRKDLLRRNVRSVSDRDIQENRDVRMSRNNRIESRERRSVQRLGLNIREHQLERTDLLRRSRSRDVDRVDDRRSAAAERRSAERREVNQLKRDDRSRSGDVDRMNIRRIEVRLQERRSTERRQEDPIERRVRRTDFSTTSRTGDLGREDVRRSVRSQIRQLDRRSDNIDRRARFQMRSTDRRDVRRSRSSDIRPVDIRRINVLSKERGTPERRQMNERREARINLSERSRDVQDQRSRNIDRLNDIRRLGIRSQERLSLERREQARSSLRRNIDRVQRSRSESQQRSVHRREENALERRERRTDASLTRSGSQDIRIKLDDPSTRLSYRERRSNERREGNEQERRQKRMNLSRNSRSEERRISRIDIPRQISWIDSLRRSSPRSSRNIARSERRERSIARDAVQERRGRLSQSESGTRRTSIQNEKISRENDRMNDRRERRNVSNGIRAEILEKSLKQKNERFHKNGMNILNLPDVGESSNNGNYEYIRQALVLALCTVYGASLLKGKGSSYSFRNILAQTNRFVAW